MSEAEREPANLLEAVQATAMLADVTLILWGGERTDRKIMNDAKAAAGAQQHRRRGARAGHGHDLRDDGTGRSRAGRA